MSKEHAINLSCSFCGKSQREVKKLIAGPKVFICDECVGLCHQIIAEEFVREGARPLSPESARAILGSIVAQALAVLEPCIATLSTTAEALRTLRPTLDALVPDEGLTMIDEAVRSVLEVRGLLVSVAAK